MTDTETPMHEFKERQRAIWGAGAYPYLQSVVRPYRRLIVRPGWRPAA
jgi:hypothetical protein